LSQKTYVTFSINKNNMKHHLYQIYYGGIKEKLPLKYCKQCDRVYNKLDIPKHAKEVKQYANERYRIKTQLKPDTKNPL